MAGRTSAALSGAHVKSRRQGPSVQRWNYKLFVFGDSFADTGNHLPTSQKSLMSREWYYPYNSSDSAHGNRAAGRFSDGLIQSDFLAKILGRDESSPPNRSRKRNDADPFGVNFAVAGSGMYDKGSPEVPSLGRQID
ncbi:GDSL esterase/lipase At5g03610-like [Phragmites australis]|uniref:GDSL esterase/lipase At5g03610-like n=1 Tax=Phragmites australis TaxID=29695 RepID=UPI002D76A4DD|nr:GDSL esterase/lipase At5g03610-like [Phragmites australis]